MLPAICLGQENNDKQSPMTALTEVGMHPSRLQG